MFQEHPNLTLPHPEDSLWRYVDLWKLVYLLDRKLLWFSRLDTLDDPYEGLPTRPLIDDMWKAIEGLPAEDRSRMVKVAEHNTQVFQMGREVLLVSCWHVNPGESAAMWRLYAPSGEGIAIRTTFENFRRSLISETTTVHGGMVEYVDFESHRPETFNILQWASLKRVAFRHESEFRAFVMSSTWPTQLGIGVSVDLDYLLSEVYVLPTAPPWHVDVVRALCNQFGVKAKVFQSRLLEHPLYMKHSEAAGSNG
jgi:hypothetical protein